MSLEEHYRRLERMYAAAPINAFYKPRMRVTEGAAVIEVEVVETFFHAAGAVHGSVYFKLLDDAAFFAANSCEAEVFVLTNTFTTYFIRPVSSGAMTATGRVVSATKTQFVAESVVHNSEGKEIGRGSGVFVRGKTKLNDVPGY